MANGQIKDGISYTSAFSMMICAYLRMVIIFKFTRGVVFFGAQPGWSQDTRVILVLLATEVEFMFPLTRGDGKSRDLVRYIVWKRRFHYGFNGFISWEIPGEIVSKFRFQWGKYVKSTSSNSADVFFSISG